MKINEWTKASMSNGNGGGCVELMRTTNGELWIRDSKLGDDSPVLKYNAFEAECFFDGMAKGEFELSSESDN